MLVAAILLSLVAAGEAWAGFGYSPMGTSITVEADSRGFVIAPASIDYTVYLDPLDSDPTVWVSTSPVTDSSGIPVETPIAACPPPKFFSSDSRNWICRLPTDTMEVGKTYYWWLRFRRRDDGTNLGPYRVSGPFTFVLVAQPPPPPPPPPPGHPAISSTKTAKSAATLPSRRRFSLAGRSIKHIVITDFVYQTMKKLVRPRTLAVACWNEVDWESVNVSGSGEVVGFWRPSQPRWLHLNPDVCDDFQSLLDHRRASSRHALAMVTVLHEALHAYGYQNEAKTNCYAVQLVPYAGRRLGLRAEHVRALGKLAISETRRTAPAGYWNSTNCRDGGGWDLIPHQRNLS